MEPNSKDFKKLQKLWYEKIEKKGFNDIEYTDSNGDGHLRFSDSCYFHDNYNEITSEAKEEYYRLAGQFLNEHEFSSKLEKMIWELHAEGVSLRNITLMLKKRRFKLYKRKVHEIVQNLAKKMLKYAREK